MQTQVSEPTPDVTPKERRRYPRTISHTTCSLRTRHGTHEYVVRNLSVCGALLVDGPQLGKHARVQAVLHIPLYPDIRVLAKVTRRGTTEDGEPFIAVEFTHGSDTTEDHIQSALLSELERSHTDGVLPADLRRG